MGRFVLPSTSGEKTAPNGVEIPEGGAMSDEQRKDEETEVEAHSPRHSANDEPSDETENDDEVEAHVRKSQPRHI
jgi:hypothetical protein